MSEPCWAPQPRHQRGASGTTWAKGQVPSPPHVLGRSCLTRPLAAAGCLRSGGRSSIWVKTVCLLPSALGPSGGSSPWAWMLRGPLGHACWRLGGAVPRAVSPKFTVKPYAVQRCQEADLGGVSGPREAMWWEECPRGSRPQTKRGEPQGSRLPAGKGARPGTEFPASALASGLRNSGDRPVVSAAACGPSGGPARTGEPAAATGLQARRSLNPTASPLQLPRPCEPTLRPARGAGLPSPHVPMAWPGDLSRSICEGARAPGRTQPPGAPPAGASRGGACRGRPRAGPAPPGSAVRSRRPPGRLGAQSSSVPGDPTERRVLSPAGSLGTAPVRGWQTGESGAAPSPAPGQGARPPGALTGGADPRL